MVKSVGSAARAEIERELGRHVHLDLSVRVRKGWRRDEGLLGPARDRVDCELAGVEIAFDETGLVPCVVQDWRTGEVLTLAYMNEEALERTRETGEMHFWSRSRGELWHKGETSGNVQRLKGAALRLRRRRAAGAGRARGPGLPHGRAHLLLPRRHGARRPRGAARAGARDRRAARRRRRGQLHGRACWPTRRTSARRCARRPRRWPARRPASRDERVAEEAADVLYHLTVLLASRDLGAGRRLRGAQCPSPLTAELTPDARGGAGAGRAGRPGPAAPHLHRRLRDARCRRTSSCAATALLPARVRRAGAALRALVLPGLPPARGDPLAARGDARRPLRDGGGGAGPADSWRRSRGCRLFAGGAVGLFGYDLVRSAEPSVGEPNPDELGVPDLAVMVAELLVAFDHLRHEVTVIANVPADGAGGGLRAAAAAVAEVRERLAGPGPPGAAAAHAEAPEWRSNLGVGRLRRGGGAREGVHPRRRHLPGGAQPALERRGPGGGVLRSTAACGPSTPARTCTSSTSRTSRSPAPHRSRW